MPSERAIIQRVRAHDVERDGYCRIGKNLLAGLGPCGGPSEWAHLKGSRRWQTRGMASEVRHTPEGTCMLCWLHHAEFDGRILGPRRSRIHIEALTDRGAEGPLAFERDGHRFEEAA